MMIDRKITPSPDRLMSAEQQDETLRRARLLLGPEPEAALTAAERLLLVTPSHLEARFIRAAALRRTGAADAARAALAPLAAQHPKAWGLQFELGAALATLGETEPAIAALARATSLNPESSLAWHALGDQKGLTGDQAGADAAQARAVPGSVNDQALHEPARLLFGGAADRAEAMLQDRFGFHLTDPLAAVLLADVGERLGLHLEVDRFLEARRDQAPRFAPLRQRRAVSLFRRHRIAEALAEVEHLQEVGAASITLRALDAAIATQLGDVGRAIRLHGELVKAVPQKAQYRIAFGHALKTAGRQADAIAAYRQGLALDPQLGDAYWSLANLKVAPFKAAEVAAMQALSDQEEALRPEQRAPLHYALGKALEDGGRYGAAFAHYQRGAAIRRAETPYDAAANRAFVRRSIATFTPAFYAARDGSGDQTEGPIFIVGLPRSGSTLVEQILASHSAVEGLSELPDLTLLAGDLAARLSAGGGAYPASLTTIDPAEFAALGAAYLRGASLYRKQDRPFFVDKFPGNFAHLGLIRLILPKARIIDVRRDPIACCFSAFKQCFAQGQAYSYDLDDIGCYYTDYLEFMAHFDRVAPRWVHRVHYESLVTDPETTVRRLLSACGLPFEASCLCFHENPRPVRTASSEQVRRPISKAAVDHWRRFEPWLDPLKAALARPFVEPGGSSAL